MKKTIETKSPTTKATKKTAETNGSNGNARPGVAVRAVEGPPPLTLQSIPAGFKQPGKAVMSRYHKPTEAQRSEAADVVTELQDSPDYAEDFTVNAPSATAIAASLLVATSWDEVYEQVSTYAVYALAMRASAWDAALRPVARLETRYDAAASDDPAIAKKYPKLATFFGARTEVAARGAETRKENKKRAKAAAAKASAATVSSTAQH